MVTCYANQAWLEPLGYERRHSQLMGIEKSLRSAASSVRKIFRDDFNRANQTGLGQSADGTSWKSVKGSFNVQGAFAAAAGTDYPIATVQMPFSDVSIDLKGIYPGSGAALWVTDAGNWVAVGMDMQGYYSCSTCADCTAYTDACTNGFVYTPSTCNQYNTAYGGFQSCQGGYNTCNARNSKYGYCNSWSCSGWYTFPYVPSGTNCVGSWNAPTRVCNGYFYRYCSATGPAYSCYCNTTYTSYIRIMRSVASTVSQLVAWAISGTANSMRIKTSGNEITVQTYSDSGLVSQIGSDMVYTASGVTIESEFGIVVKPSSSYQGYSIGEIAINKN